MSGVITHRPELVGGDMILTGMAADVFTYSAPLRVCAEPVGEDATLYSPASSHFVLLLLMEMRRQMSSPTVPQRLLVVALLPVLVGVDTTLTGVAADVFTYDASTTSCPA